MNRVIYMDNAATTSVKPEVLNAMLPYFTEEYGNPSSVYSFAQKSRTAIDETRATIAGIIGAAKSNEIYFQQVEVNLITGLLNQLPLA